MSERMCFEMMRKFPNEEVKKVMRSDLKRIWMRQEDELAKSMSDRPRRRFDENGEGYTDFGIYDISGMEIDRIVELVDDMAIEPCGCYYDCCGHPFTRNLSHRYLPDGRMSVIHSVGYNF